MRISASSGSTTIGRRSTASVNLAQSSAHSVVTGPEQGALDCAGAVASNWILNGGAWHDSGVWSDSATWED